MDETKARDAAALIATLDAMTEMLGRVDRAIAGSWPIQDLRAVDPENGRGIQLVTAPLDPTLSSQGLSFVRGIYQAKINALNEQIAAL